MPRSPSASRALQRAKTIDQIKSIARGMMIKQGTASLSLRGIAGEMGVVPAALYRYYASRDDLITALIVDAFHSYAEALQAAYDANQKRSTADRIIAMGRAYRRWALDHLTDFHLIYGTPIPDYKAPAEVTTPESALGFVPLATTITEAVEQGDLKLEPLPDARLQPQLEGLASAYEGRFSPPVVYTGLIIWQQVHGFVILEAFGHMQTFGDTNLLYESELNDMLRRLGWRS